MADARELRGRAAKRMSSLSCTRFTDDDGNPPRGRSTKHITPLSCTRSTDDEQPRGRSASRSSFFARIPHASSSDYIDHTTTPLPPALMPTAGRSNLLDIFRSTKRTDPFRPLSPPHLTPKEQAQCHLRTARLELLHELGHRHPLMSRVKLNGTLKPASTQLYHELYSVVDTFPRQQTRPAHMSRSSKIRAAEPLSEISRHANAIEAYRGRVKAQRERLQKRAIYWVGEKTSDMEAARASQRNAKNMEIERRHELNAEMRKFNAELEVKVSALGQVFDDAIVTRFC